MVQTNTITSQAMTDSIYPDVVVRTGDAVVTAMCFFSLSDCSPDTQLLVTGTDAGTVLVWNLTTQTIVQTLHTQSSMVLSIHPLISGDSLLVYTRSQKVTLITKCEDQLKFRIVYEMADALATCPTFCPAAVSTFKSSWLLGVPSDKSIHLYTIDLQMSGVKRLDSVSLCTKAMVTSVMFSDGDSSALKMFVATEAGNISLYKTPLAERELKDELSPLSSLDMLDGEPVLTLDYISTHQLGVAAGASTKVSLWACENWTMKLLAHIDTPSRGFNCVRLRSDSKLLVACSWDGLVRLYSSKSARLLALLDFHRESATYVAFDINNCFVTASKDKSLCLWKLYANT